MCFDVQANQSHFCLRKLEYARYLLYNDDYVIIDCDILCRSSHFI